MDDLNGNKHSQGWLEWLLFKAVGAVKQVDLFELRPDECQCGDRKNPEDSMCERCRAHGGFAVGY